MQKKPYLTYNDGTYDFSSNNNHFGNISAVANGTFLDVPTGGRWLKMQTVLEYDSTAESYNSTYYVDGSPIKTTDGNVAVTKITISDSTRKARLRDNRAYINKDALYIRDIYVDKNERLKVIDPKQCYKRKVDYPRHLMKGLDGVDVLEEFLQGISIIDRRRGGEWKQKINRYYAREY